MEFPHALLLFNLGTGEILVLILLFLLLFGAHRIPDIARALGRAQRDYQRAKDEVEREADTAPTATEDDRVRRAAQDLGIVVEGKSVQELKAAIAERMGGPSMRSA